MCGGPFSLSKPAIVVMEHLVLSGFVILIATALVGCSGSNGEFVELKADGGSGVSNVVRPDQGTALASRPIDAPGVYKIGYADVLDISVFKVPELTRTVEVAESGTINLPLVGDVFVAGKTVRDIERDLAKKLEARYLQSPQVTVFVKEFNSQLVTVEGAVKKPGVHALKGKTTLLQLIAMSGGVDRDISDSTVVVFRNADRQRQTKFDIDDIHTGQTQDPLIFPGDVVVANSSPLKAAWSEVIKGSPAASTAKAATH